MSAEETLARLARLERALARLRVAVAIGAVVLLAACLGVVESFREDDDLTRYGLETSSVMIRDPAGRPVYLAGNHADGAYFRFVDGSGVDRVFFRLEQAGPALNLFDSTGCMRARLLVRDTGGRLEFFDETGQRTWTAP